MNTQDTGNYIESYACQFLTQNACMILERNFRSYFGEIDIIARSTELQLLFIEVRFRKNNSFGGALASIDTHKQQKIIRTAQWYLQKNQLEDSPCRFDVIAVSGKNDALDVDWIHDAFC
jgi:putative endonuclease